MKTETEATKERKKKKQTEAYKKRALSSLKL